MKGTWPERSLMLPADLLLPGEAVLLRTRRHILVLLVPLFLIVLAGLWLAGEVCRAAFARNLDGWCPPLAGMTVILAGLPFLLEWLATVYILTNLRVIFLQAPVWMRTRFLWLADIESVTYCIGLLGRLFGFGEVILGTAATQGGRVRLLFVPRPGEVRDRIAEAIRDARP